MNHTAATGASTMLRSGAVTGGTGRGVPGSTARPRWL